MPRMPKWMPPEDVARALDDGDGFWEDERWSPIRLTAMSGTEFEGRQIPVAWQVEFDPSDEDLAAASARLEAMGFPPDGYGWCEYVVRAVQKTDPALAERLRTSDCETDTCVIWVESDEDCRRLLEATWKLVFAE
jgi:hypothetical protein